MPDGLAVDRRVLSRLIGRVFPGAGSVSVEAAGDRRMVVVYRARVDEAVFYLRLAEGPGQDLTTDGGILDRLRTLGVSVPAVVAAEAAPPELARSYMIVTEIPGRGLAGGGNAGVA